jgi:hypothetical protein
VDYSTILYSGVKWNCRLYSRCSLAAAWLWFDRLAGIRRKFKVINMKRYYKWIDFASDIVEEELIFIGITVEILTGLALLGVVAITGNLVY